MKQIKLVEIDLRKGNESTHPDIVVGKTQYLAKFKGDPRLYAGVFTKEWYGLSFDGWGTSGRQFDTPGYNSSSWQRLWRVMWE